MVVVIRGGGVDRLRLSASGEVGIRAHRDATGREERIALHGWIMKGRKVFLPNKIISQ